MANVLQLLQETLELAQDLIDKVRCVEPCVCVFRPLGCYKLVAVLKTLIIHLHMQMELINIPSQRTAVILFPIDK